jgi:hypothetical protein
MASGKQEPTNCHKDTIPDPIKQPFVRPIGSETAKENSLSDNSLSLYLPSSVAIKAVTGLSSWTEDCHQTSMRQPVDYDSKPYHHN